MLPYKKEGNDAGARKKEKAGKRHACATLGNLRLERSLHSSQRNGIQIYPTGFHIPALFQKTVKLCKSYPK